MPKYTLILNLPPTAIRADLADAIRLEASDWDEQPLTGELLSPYYCNRAPAPLGNGLDGTWQIERDPISVPTLLGAVVVDAEEDRVYVRMDKNSTLEWRTVDEGGWRSGNEVQEILNNGGRVVSEGVEV